MSNGTAGAPTGAPTRPRRRRRGGRPTVKGQAALTHDPAVLEWVRDRIREGLYRDAIVAASAAGEYGWPRPGEALSNGSEGVCRTAIYHLERAGVSWPLQTGEPARSPRSTASRMMAEVAQIARDAEARDVVHASREVLRAAVAVEALDVVEYTTGVEQAEATIALWQALEYLHELAGRAQARVALQIGEQRAAETIRMLRVRSTDPSSTPAERAAAARLLELRERQARAPRLNGGSG